MTRILYVLAALLLLASPAFGQGTDDCPAGAPRHVALTRLEHAPMEAAYLASFRGRYHREPTGAPGSGPDDTGQWIRYYDHFGQYSDGICRGGWNAYTEDRLWGAASSDPGLGDLPARFLPAGDPPIVPPVVTPPIVVPAAVVDLAPLQTAVANLRADLDAFEAQSVQFYDDARGIGKTIAVWLAKYAAPLIAALMAGRALK